MDPSSRVQQGLVVVDNMLRLDAQSKATIARLQCVLSNATTSCQQLQETIRNDKAEIKQLERQCEDKKKMIQILKTQLEDTMQVKHNMERVANNMENQAIDEQISKYHDQEANYAREIDHLQEQYKKKRSLLETCQNLFVSRAQHRLRKANTTYPALTVHEMQNMKKTDTQDEAKRQQILSTLKQGLQVCMQLKQLQLLSSDTTQVQMNPMQSPETWVEAAIDTYMSITDRNVLDMINMSWYEIYTTIKPLVVYKFLPFAIHNIYSILTQKHTPTQKLCMQCYYITSVTQLLEHEQTAEQEEKQQELEQEHEHVEKHEHVSEQDIPRSTNTSSI